MRTQEEILERYTSEDSEDMFNAQRTALLCMLPYEVAKPHLDPIYVAKHDGGELPEDEVWKEEWDVKEQILDFLPHLYSSLATGNSFELSVGLCYLRTWTWAEDDAFYNEVSEAFGEVVTFGAFREVLNRIAEHYGYEPPIVDTPFMEIVKDENDEPEIDS